MKVGYLVRLRIEPVSQRQGWIGIVTGLRLGKGPEYDSANILWPQNGKEEWWRLTSLVGFNESR